MQRYRGKDLRKGRVSEHGRVYLVTTNTARREALFADWPIGRLVCHQLKREHDTAQVTSLAWVVMPDHLHWVLELKAGSLPGAIPRVKIRSAIAINSALGRTGSVWQRGFHDRALRREDHLKAVARYVIANPIRAGLVTM